MIHYGMIYINIIQKPIVEIGYFVAITMGQQRWLKTLNIDHHKILAGTDASIYLETPDHKSSAIYWAKDKKTSLPD